VMGERPEKERSEIEPCVQNERRVASYDCMQEVVGYCHNLVLELCQSSPILYR
jgi:hypothetical protein